MTKAFSFQVKKENGQLQVLAVEQLKASDGKIMGGVQGELSAKINDAAKEVLSQMLIEFQVLLEGL